MKTLLTILTIFISSAIYSQDSIRVKIIKIKGNQVWMKTIDKPKMKLFSFCKCPYKEKQIIWIKKP